MALKLMRLNLCQLCHLHQFQISHLSIVILIRSLHSLLIQKEILLERIIQHRLLMSL